MRLPEGWKLAKIGEIAKFYSGGTPSKLNDKFWGGVHPWITAKDLKKHYLGNSIDTLTDIGFAKAKIAPLGATLILVRGMTLLKNFPVGYATRPMSFNQDIKALVPLQGTDGLFLSFFLVAQKDKIRQFVSIASHGTGKLDTEIIKGLSIKIPPFPEQQKIAQILSTWDKAIEKLEALIAAKQKRKKALMQQLLTGKKRFPGFNGKWKDIKLKAVFNEIKDKNDGAESHSIMTISSRLGLISQEDKFDRVIAGDSLKKYTQLTYNDFAYNKGNSKSYRMGCIYQLEDRASALVPFVYICFSPTDEVCSSFYKHWFLAHGLDRQLKKIITSGARGDGLLNVNTKDFFSLKIPFPTKKEQIAIAEILQAADQEITTHQNQLTALKQQKQGLMQQLLTGKVRVKLKPEGTIQ